MTTQGNDRDVDGSRSTPRNRLFKQPLNGEQRKTGDTGHLPLAGKRGTGGDIRSRLDAGYARHPLHLSRGARQRLAAKPPEQVAFHRHCYLGLPGGCTGFLDKSASRPGSVWRCRRHWDLPIARGLRRTPRPGNLVSGNLVYGPLCDRSSRPPKVPSCWPRHRSGSIPGGLLHDALPAGVPAWRSSVASRLDRYESLTCQRHVADRRAATPALWIEVHQLIDRLGHVC